MERTRMTIRTDIETKQKYDELVMRWSLATGRKMKHGEVLAILVNEKLENLKKEGEKNDENR